jgi:hypothetical protein
MQDSNWQGAKQKYLNKKTYIILGVFIILATFIAVFQIIGTNQENIDSITVTNSNQEQKEKVIEQPTITNKTPLCQARRVILSETYKILTDEDKARFNKFLADHGIPESSRDYAALNYFYPNGFISPGPDGITLEYLDNMLTSSFYFVTYPYTNMEKRRFFNTTYNFAFTYPLDWPTAGSAANAKFALSPSTKVYPGGRYYRWEEAFDVFVYEEYQPKNKTYEQMVRFFLENFSRNNYATITDGPEKIDIFGKKEVEKYVLETQNGAFGVPNYGNGKFITEFYFFKKPGTYYAIYFKYSTAAEALYRKEAEAIAKSVEAGGLNYCKDMPDELTDEQKMLFHPTDDGTYESLFQKARRGNLKSL